MYQLLMLIIKLFYQKFTTCQDPLAARMSSADLLDRFNAPLLYHGQDMWDIKGKNGAV